MQTTSVAYQTMAGDNIRYPTHNLLVSWLKDYDPSIIAFTIGTSLIGGVDVISGTGSNIAESDKFSYIDESEHVMLIEYERELIQPVSSVARAMADVMLDNNTGRFTPGEDITIGSYILPRRPVRLYLGFNINSLPEVVQVFVGEIAEFPEINRNENLVRLHCRDFFDVIWNTPLEQTVIYTNMRSDEIISQVLQLAGLSTNQFILDAGINTISFAYFQAGDKLGTIIQKIVEAELGRFYLDEIGIYHFESRSNWLNISTSVITITESMVKREETLSTDNIVNLVEVRASPRILQSNRLIWQTIIPVQINPGQTYEIFPNYTDPVASVDLPIAGSATSYYSANTAIDGSGSNITSSIDRDDWDNFAQASKGIFTNNAAVTAYLTLVVWGRPAEVIDPKVFIRYQDDDSVETYGEHTIVIDNDYIQDSNFATALAQILITDRKDPGDYRDLTIIANPALQLGDLITWQGILYNIIRIKTRFSESDGLIQTLTIVKRTLLDYFTIGSSTIGSLEDAIAP